VAGALSRDQYLRRQEILFGGRSKHRSKMMRYKIVMWPFFDETLCVVSTFFEGYERGSDYTRQVTLKTEGADWDLPDRLRELADQWDARA
jgi:hypothetical protein